jgi:hypothetical protein
VHRLVCVMVGVTSSLDTAAAVQAVQGLSRLLLGRLGSTFSMTSRALNGVMQHVSAWLAASMAGEF